MFYQLSGIQFYQFHGNYDTYKLKKKSDQNYLEENQKLKVKSSGYGKHHAKRRTGLCNVKRIITGTRISKEAAELAITVLQVHGQNVR